jgi:predicted permease
MAKWLEDAWKDAGFAIRQFRRTPGIAAVAVVSLALGIGANAAIFTLLDAVVFRQLPIRDPQTLVMLGQARSSGVGVGMLGRSLDVYSVDLYQHLLNTNVFDGLCAVQSGAERIGVRRRGVSATEPAVAKFVSGNYFQVLGVAAAAGRTLDASDDTPQATPVAIVSFRYWQRVLNDDPSVVGATIDINGVPVTIVGVAAASFYGEKLQADPPSFWIPINASRAINPQRNLVNEPGAYWLYLLGRLKPGTDVPQAESRLTMELQNWQRSLQGADLSAPTAENISRSRVEITPAASGVPHLRREYASTLRLLLGISMAVLLIACANIAALLLAQGIARRGEHSVRLALGATYGRLLRQSIVESLVLAFTGGAVALLVAAHLSDLLLALVFGGTAQVPIQTMPDGRVLAFTFVVSCLTAIAFGMMPAIRMPSSIATTLRDTRFRLGKGLIVAEVTAALVVLAGAVSLAHSLVNLTGQPFGFDRRHVFVAAVDPSLAGVSLDRFAAQYPQLEDRLAAIPGVTSAGFSRYSPFNGCCWSFSVSVPGYTAQPEEDMGVLLNRVSPRYFETLGTPLVRGRAFDARDSAGSPPVAIVSATFAERFFAGRDPIGQRFTIDSEGGGYEREIVGVVADAKYDELRAAEGPAAFLPFMQMPPGTEPNSGGYESNFANAIQVRVSGDAPDVAARIRQTLAAMVPELTVLRVDTLSDQVGETLRQDRAVVTLAVAFAVLALTLTCVGLYGLMAYLVQRRTKEIGIRMALGADHGLVVRMVVRQALTHAGAGILLGVPAAFAAVRVIRNQLYGVNPSDPANAALAAAVLIACLALAGYLPARRAARIDPVRTLRQE